MQLFLSYARPDREAARELFAKLKQRDFEVWFDEESLLPGQIWQAEISRAIQNSTLVIVMLSTRSVSRAGYAQKELRAALEAMERLPHDQAFVVPVRLDDCPLPEPLSHIHSITLTTDDDFERLVNAIHAGKGNSSVGQTTSDRWRQIPSLKHDDRPLIEPGQGAASIRLGDSKAAVEMRLGRPERIGKYSDAHYWSYMSKGIAVAFQRPYIDYVNTIFLHHDKADGFAGFRGATAEGIDVNATRRQIEAIYGPPSVERKGSVIRHWAYYRAHGLGATYDTTSTSDMDAVVYHLSIFGVRGERQ